MKKVQGLGRVLSKREQKGIFGGSEGTCVNTCWCELVGGDECGHVDVTNCQGTNLDACKSIPGCANVPKTTCSCD